MTKTESHRVEYKAELSKELDLEKEVIAFLNSKEGGLIYLGIANDGEVLGLQNADEDMLKVKDRIKNNISPSAMGLFDVELEECDTAKQVIKVNVAVGSEKPYFKRKYGMSDKGCFVRIGSASEPMNQKMIDDLFSKRTRNSVGKIKSPRQRLSFEQLRIYYQEKQKQLNDHFQTNLELETDDGDLNYVAYLLADENNISFKIAKYKGDTRVDLVENNEYGYCSIIKTTKNILEKIDIENPTLSQITPKERLDQRLWNEVALREVIINAMVHNDYTHENPPKIEIFSDRIEITSSGGLPEALSQEEFFEGFSIPRNKELIRIFKDLGLVEQLGSGIPRILEFYDRSCFRFSDHFLRIVFPALEVIKEGSTIVSPTLEKSSEKTSEEGSEKMSKKNSEKTLKPNEQVGSEKTESSESVSEKSSEKSSEKILRLIENDPEITTAKLSDDIGVSTRAIEKHLKNLRNTKQLKRVGPDKGGYWKVLS